MNTTRRATYVWAAVITTMAIAVWATWSWIGSPSDVLRPLRALNGREKAFFTGSAESHQFFFTLPCARVHGSLEETRNALVVSPSLRIMGASEEALNPRDGGGCHVYVSFRRTGWIQDTLYRIRERFWPERMIY